MNATADGMCPTTDAVGAATLRAALSAMDDDWESELSALFGLEHECLSDASSADKRSANNERKESTPATNSQRREITKLRDEIAELQSTLAERMASRRLKLNIPQFIIIEASTVVDAQAGVSGGIVYGLVEGMRFCSLTMLFYVGRILVADGTVSFENMYMVMMVFYFGMRPIGMAAQGLQDQSKTKQAAERIFAIIDRTPAVDSTDATGESLANVEGDIEFRDVAFAYPGRPDAQLYTKYNLRVKAGQTVALVGASGSGKSTAIELLERFYNPSAGSITLDSHDLRSLSLPWLRERISLVSQEPVLFGGSIADNIAMGKPGATRDEIVDAAKKTNAFDFIANFPQGLDSDIGDRGAQISGGQKQRIAIARAILRDWSVLLLDEATSALDNESERVVQASLDALLTHKKRTTIIVAHRLSTIRNADAIAVTKDGVVAEFGTHNELMAVPGGVYRSLVVRDSVNTDAKKREVDW